MKKTLLRSLLIGSCTLAPVVAFAGGLDNPTCCQPPRVDIPDMREGWGFTLEGAAIRGYNNDLTYAVSPESIVTIGAFTSESVTIEEIKPDYAFDLLVGVDYTLAGSGNVLKLSYEHLFNKTSSASQYDVFDDYFEGSVQLKLDAVDLLSEQHILIGPYWEATLTGGLRYARVSQDFDASVAVSALGVREALALDSSFVAVSEDMQFNGVGPLGGLGSMFHLTENFALGGEGQMALLIGRNKASVNALEVLPVTVAAADVFVFDDKADNIYSIVPELKARIFGNYFYRFQDGMELQVEAGWKIDQFFNLRTNTTNVSNDIGFSGPYLKGHIKL